MRVPLIAALLLTLLVAGCGEDEEPQPSVAEIVDRSARNTAALKGFHFALTVENGAPRAEGLNITFADGDIVVPDGLRAKVSGTLSGVPLESELIAVGDQDFLRDPVTQKWRRLEAGTNPAAFFDPAKGVLAIMKRAARLQTAGSDEVGGADSYRLSGEVPATDLVSLLGGRPARRGMPVELWVGKQDLILRRIRLAGPALEAEPSNVVRTIEISNFDRVVKIEPPEVAP